MKSALMTASTPKKYTGKNIEVKDMPQTVDHVRLSRDGKSLIILDQSRLPNHSEYIVLASAEAMYEAIKSLRVRGAPAIGIFAGYAMYVLASRL